MAFNARIPVLSTQGVEVHPKMILEDWGEPQFPEHIGLIDSAYRNHAFAVEDLNGLAGQVEGGFTLLEIVVGPETTDGSVYRWSVGYRYAVPGGGEVMLLFPKRDRKQVHVALYVRGIEDLTDGRACDFLEEFFLALMC